MLIECFLFLRDNRSYPNFNVPLLTGAYYADPDAMTIESCLAFCENQPVPYRLAAITDGFQCCAFLYQRYHAMSLHVYLAQHATISSSTFSRAQMGAMHRAAAIRRRRAAVGATSWRAPTQRTTRTLSSRPWSPRLVSGKALGVTSWWMYRQS